MTERPWRRINDGLDVRVRLTPKSSRDQVEGIETTADGPALKARVRAVPEDGAANAALARLIADWANVPKSRVEVVAGHTSRVKVLRITGDADALDMRLAVLVSDS